MMYSRSKNSSSACPKIGQNRPSECGTYYLEEFKCHGPDTYLGGGVVGPKYRGQPQVFLNAQVVIRNKKN